MPELRSIGSFAKVRRGASPRPIGDPKYFGESSVGWVRISDVTQRSYKYLKNTEQYLSPLGESRSLRVNKGDLIMSICATVGKPVIVDMPACIHDGFVQIYDIDDVDTEYLFYLLQFHEKDFEKRGQPGTQVNLNTTIVENEIVFVPKELDKQQKIAHILTTVDNLIEKTQALIDKYTAVKQGMMHDLFTRGIDLATGQLRPSYEQAPELYKETELGWVPREWGVVTLGSLATRITNGFVGVATPFYSTNESGVQYLYGNNVRKDRLELHSVLYVTREFHEKQKKSQLQPGDMLTVQSGHIGTTAVVPPDAGDMNCHALIITKFKAGIANSDFISAYCNSEIGMQRMESIFIGSTILHINTSDLKEFKVLLPALDEQNAIYGRLSAINAKINTESGLLEKAKLQKKGLMQDLLTGRVRVA